MELISEKVKVMKPMDKTTWIFDTEPKRANPVL